MILRPDYLPPALADAIAGQFESATDWDRVVSSNVYGPDHQYFAGACMPRIGEPYLTDFDRSAALESQFAERNWLPGREHRCYRLGPGQHFRIHSDAYFGGTVSHTLYLNREWVWDWGGLLHVIDGDRCEVVCPTLNTLATIENQPHFVSPVAAWAPRYRYVFAVLGGT